MSKKTMGPQTMLFPKPVVLVGANVNDTPDFTTVAFAGIVCAEPPMIAIGLQHHRYILKGIRQNMTFSINIPSADLVKETDYCGIVSGAKTDKVRDCRFKVFYGGLAGAPLIEQCPVNLECEVLHILNLGSHEVIIGRIKESHVSETCLTEGQPDIMKINPIVFSRGSTSKYNATGEFLAEAFSIGKELKVGEKT